MFKWRCKLFTKLSIRRFALAALVSVSAFSFSGTASSAAMFNNGLPAGWTAAGNAGTLGANGVVTLPPTAGATQYGYVSTFNGVTGVGALPGIVGTATNGSTLTSSAFSATAGQNLQFFFDYVTTDGAAFSDYAWAQLIDAVTNTVVATLFTARTTPGGNTVPGNGMPVIAAITTPAVVSILTVPGTTPSAAMGGVGLGVGPTWSALGSDSGNCYAAGCGYTGWVQADYAIAAAGSYLLKFGVTNMTDTSYQSGMAFAGITIGGVQIANAAPVPVPGSLALLGLGLAGLMVQTRRRQFS